MRMEPRWPLLALAVWLSSIPSAAEAQWSILEGTAAAAAPSENNLRQLHVITRHGARLPLTKDANNNLAEGDQEEDFASRGPPLTATGERELYDLGAWIRQRYTYSNASGDGGDGDLLFARYDPRQVLLESSALDRTVASAAALALGLFPAAARDPFRETRLPAANSVRPNVPVFTTELVNDVTLRAHDKCPAFHDRLEDLYARSAAWKELEERYDPLLTKLAAREEFSEYAEGSRIPLKSVWNVYDHIVVRRLECRRAGGENYTATCQSLSPFELDDDEFGTDEWTELQQAAHQAELLKYNRTTAGDMVGGNLVKTIVDRMALHHHHHRAPPSSSTEEQKQPQFFLYSAHYPTLLGVKAVLDEHSYEGDVIPGYGAALLIEVYDKPRGWGDAMVRIHYKPGDGDADELATLERSCFLPETQCMLYEDLKLFAQFYSVPKWCEECGNAEADVCLQNIVQTSCGSSSSNGDTTTTTTTTTGSEPSPSSKLDRPALAGTVIGLVVGAMLALLGSWCCQKRQKRAENVLVSEKTHPQEAEADTTTSSSASFA